MSSLYRVVENSKKATLRNAKVAILYLFHEDDLLDKTNSLRNLYIKLQNLYMIHQDENILLQAILTSLEEFVELNFVHLRDLHCEDFVNSYAEQWDNFYLSSDLLSKAMNDTSNGGVKLIDYLPEQKKNVKNLCYTAWMSIVIDRLKQKIIYELMTGLEEERNCRKRFKCSSMKTVLDSLLELGSSFSFTDGEELCLYKEIFEQNFLSSTEVFYRRGCSLLNESNTEEILKKIEFWINEEDKKTYLLESTKRALDQLLENVVLEKYAETFQSGFEDLLANEKVEDLKRMFHLLRRISGGLEQLTVRFGDYVHRQGLVAIEKCNEADAADPRPYVAAIVDIHRRYDAIVQAAFEGEAGFAKALDEACTKFINRNAVTESSGSTTKSAEVLAKYCDIHLKKRPNDNEGLNIVDDLNQAMIIFKYIDDKDIFHSFYSRLLAKRLIVERVNAAGNDDVEMIMICKLREACGFEYTSKLRKMYHDVCVSRDLNDKFRESDAAANLDVDFGIHVISSSSWPFKQTFTFHLPQELEQCVQLFSAFYDNQHSGRKLSWLHEFSRGELVSKCHDKPYVLQVSTFQMAVLLQFNGGDAFLTVSQLEESTGIERNVLLQILQALEKSNFLILKGSGPNASLTVSLNTDYKNKKLKVNINRPIKSAAKSERDDVHRRVEESRKLLIQAAIVRIAKARKVVRHQMLLSEVLEQLSAKFIPEIADIKKCIEILFERGYLERVETDSYGYVA